MKKTLLAAINSKFIHTNLAFLYLKRVSPAHTPVEITEYTVNQNIYDILSDIVLRNPEVIAFSVYIWNTETVRKLLIEIPKLLPDAVIILGGPEVSYTAKEWLELFPQIDYIITGGGEKGWLKLLESGYKLPERIISLPNTAFNEIPFPYDEENIAQYCSPSAGKNMVYYESSRGCPFRCSFCLSSRQDITLEYRNLEKVEEELLFFIEREIRLVKFADRTFNSDRQRALSIWRFILENNRTTRFHFEVNPYLLNDEDIAFLQQIPKNFFQFEIGIQSTNCSTLRETERSLSDKDNGLPGEMTERIKAIRNNIDVHLDLVFGLPYEGYSEAQASFNTVYSMEVNHFQPGVLKILAGTELEKRAEEYGMVYQSLPPYRVLKTDWLSFEQLNELSSIEHLVNNLYNSHKFVRTAGFLVSLYPSPYPAYKELLLFWEKRGKSLWLKDWGKTALLLIDFVAYHRYELKPELLDCLRWDLCFHTGFNSYPSFLMDNETDNLLKVWSKAKKRKRENMMLPVSSLKSRKAIVYKPVSEWFRKCYNIAEDDCFVAVNDEKGETGSIRFSFAELTAIEDVKT